MRSKESRRSKGTKPLFVDTGAFYARFDEGSSRHDRTETIFEGIGRGDVLYRPLYSSSYVLDELATLIPVRGTAARSSRRLKFLGSEDEFRDVRKSGQRVREIRRPRYGGFLPEFGYSSPSDSYHRRHSFRTARATSSSVSTSIQDGSASCVEASGGG